MLPDLRVAIVAIIAAVGLLLAGFGVAATFRVAQQSRPSPLQAARSALPTGPALRVEAVAPVVSRDAAPADHSDETASIAPNGAPPPAVDEPAPVVAATAIVAPAPVIAAAPLAAPAPDIVAATAAPPADRPEPVGPVAAAAHADAPIVAVPAPAAELPVGGPLEQAALTPAATPLAKPVVKKKPRAAVPRPRVDWEKARARTAAKRAARARRATPQNTFQDSWQQNSWPQDSWQRNSRQQNWPTKPTTGFEGR